MPTQSPIFGDLTEFDLGVQGMQHVKRSLEGGLGLSRLIVESFDLNVGRCFTLLPSSTPQRTTLDFLEGGLQKVNTTNMVFATLLQGVLLTTSFGILVAENSLARCDDPIIDGEPVHRFCVKGAVYEYVPSRDITRKGIESAIRIADAGYRLNLVATTPRRKISLPRSRSTANEGVLHDLALGAAIVLVRAYDGEGFVAWVPERESVFASRQD